MTSKQAVNNLSEYIGRLGGGETQEWEDIILKDLEILETVKKMYTSEKVELTSYEFLPEAFCNAITKEEWDIFREWVKNNKIEYKPEHRSLDDIQKKKTEEKFGLAEIYLNRIADALEDIKDIFKWLER